MNENKCSICSLPSPGPLGLIAVDFYSYAQDTDGPPDPGRTWFVEAHRQKGVCRACQERLLPMIATEVRRCKEAINAAMTSTTAQP